MRTGHRAGMLGLGLVVAGVVLAGAPRPGEACINGVEFAVDPRTQMVARAEGDANEGRLLDALKNIAVSFTGDIPAARTPLQDRALLVEARAIARSRGRLGRGGKEAEGEAAVADNLALAAKIVEERVAREPANGALRTDQGEVLAALPARRAEGRAILEDLERRKLMASAHGYAALVRVRETAGMDAPSWVGPALVAMNQAPRAIAFARCDAMAKEKSICDTQRPQLASSL